MKFALKFREQYADLADGSVKEEFDNLFAFLEILWNKIVDSEGNLKVSLTDNSTGGAGTKPVFQTLSSTLQDIYSTLGSFSAGGDLQTAELTIALNGATSQTIVPAQGAGSIILPIFWSLDTITTTAIGGSAPNIDLRYAGLGTVIADQLNTGANSIQHLIGRGRATTTASHTFSNIANKDVQCELSATAGGTWVGTCKAKVWYFLWTP